MSKSYRGPAGEPVRPSVCFLTSQLVGEVVEEAERLLEGIGVDVEHARAVEMLSDAGARVGSDGRVRIGAELVRRALQTVPSQLAVYDRDGHAAVRIGGDEVHFDPGSAAIKVYDYDERRARPATRRDCHDFARLTEQLPGLTLQSTSVVPSDVPLEAADRTRLRIALSHGRKPIVTGTFAGGSFETMRRMLVAVRGSASALRERPLAIFDCCPSPPLKWSALTCEVLVRCAEEGIPAELVSMPLTGATAPVTLLGAIAQHTAENLSGIVIHQLAGRGSPIIYGGSPSAFDMRHGTTPMGAIETMMIDCAYAQIGKQLRVPTHAYMALSDAKLPDYQAGMESAMGALLAVLGAVNVVSGPGMLDFESCQSLEKLVLDGESCAMALRAGRGIARRDDPIAVGVVAQAIASGQFLALGHTRRWYRDEVTRPGPTVDRQVGDAWASAGGRTALQRAHDEVIRLLAAEGAPPLGEALEAELDELLGSDA